MLSYAKNEMINISEFENSVSGFVDKISSKVVEKIAIVKDNKPKAVLISADEYEKLKEFDEYLEAIEIERIITERVINAKKPIKMLNEDDIREIFKARGIDF